jgi:AsmA protein
MKPRELPWKWLLLGLGALTLGVLLLPRLFGDTARLGDRAAEQLSAWTGGEVTLVGPVTVRYFPDVSVTAGLQLKGSKRLPMVESISVKEAKISIDLAELLLGHVRIDALALRRPNITLAAAAEPGAAPQSFLTSLVSGVPVSAVHVRGGKIIVPNGTEPEQVEKINAHFDINEAEGGVSGFGKFTWRDVDVRFALDSGSVADSPDGTRLPVSLVLTADPIRAKLEGTASLKGAFGLDGTMVAEIPDARRLLAWLGIPLGEGQGLKTLTASGAFHLAGATLTFDDGSFSLDGNKAQGLLALTGGARPRVEGTLDFDRLVLDPYLAPTPTSTTETPPPFRDSDPFDWPLVQALDADLRVSAAAIHARGLKLGRGAITITAKQGMIIAELGELELCGGEATGHAGLDLTQPAKHLTLDASLTDIATESCLQQLAIDLPLKGVGGIKTEVATEGRDAGELLKGLSGSLKITAHDGAVPVDFSHLMIATVPLEGQGWSPSASTPFAQLDADCRLGGGHLWCQTFSMQTPAGLVAGSGDIDLPAQTIDWDVAIANPAEAAKTSETASQEIPKVSIRGSLTQPSIRRADRSTLGDGSPQVSPLAPVVSQH